MGTKLEELRDGCFAAAMDDEPMFVLLARDPDAPRVVRNWAAQREDEIARRIRPASDLAKVSEARQCADRMERWRKAHDGEWRGGLFAAQAPIPAFIGHGEGVIGHARYESLAPQAVAAKPHHIRQENDEYACSCGKRWEVSEGEDHP